MKNKDQHGNRHLAGEENDSFRLIFNNLKDLSLLLSAEGVDNFSILCLVSQVIIQRKGKYAAEMELRRRLKRKYPRDDHCDHDQIYHQSSHL